LHGDAYPIPNDALQAAVNRAAERDLVLICGSVFLVGEVDIRQIRFQ
jgi:folylpolyglutamate synthase/dihydropteroate synthase